MIDAVVRLIAISFISILCVAALLFGVRQFSYPNPMPHFVHPLLQSSPLLIIKLPADRSDYPSLAYFKDISAQWPKALLDKGDCYDNEMHMLFPEQAQRLRMGRPRSANDQEKSETLSSRACNTSECTPLTANFTLNSLIPILQ